MKDSSTGVDTLAIHAVTFDIGGTLLSPYPSVGEVYAEVLAANGFSSDPACLERSFRTAWKAAEAVYLNGQTDEGAERDQWFGIVQATLRDIVPDEQMESLFNQLWDTFAESRRWRLRDHTRDVLIGLRKRGLRTAVLSNWDSRLRPLLDETGLSEHFDRLFISAEIGFRKPDPRLFEIATTDLDVPPEHLLHVGDSLANDIHPALTAGWNAVLIGETPEPPEGHHTIRDLREVLDLALPKG